LHRDGSGGLTLITSLQETTAHHVRGNIHRHLAAGFTEGVFI
jgi:hypothetical protein